MTAIFAWVCAGLAALFTLGAAYFFDKSAEEGIAVARSEAAQADQRAEQAHERAAKLEVEAVEAKTQLANAETRLLAEQRLTSQERYWLTEIGKATLSRTMFVNWDALSKELRAGHFEPINLAVVRWPFEAKFFGDKLRAVLQDAGLLKRYFELPYPIENAPFSSSGFILSPADAASSPIADALAKFGINCGGNSGLPKEWSEVPPAEVTLVVQENGQWMTAGSTGHAGEGADATGHPVPP